MTASRLAGVALIALVAVHAECSKAETAAPQVAANACAFSALTAMNKAAVELYGRQHGLMLTLEEMIELRRLHERYCTEYARCMVVDLKPTAELADTVASSEFSWCLQMEEGDQAPDGKK